MPRKGMRGVFFRASPPPSSSAPPQTLALDTFRATLMEDNIATAELLIHKWDPEGSAFAKITSLFYESRREARQFLVAVQDLHQAMHFFAASPAVKPSHHNLIRGQRLMETAMARLQKEFYQILAANRDRLDPESVTSARSSLSTATASSFLSEDYLSDTDVFFATAGEDVARAAKPPTAVMVDLRAIAQCMISCGYSQECLRAYKSIRKSIVDEGLYRLGFDRLTPAQIQKLDWDSLERKIDAWLSASSVAMRTLFSGERALCEFVFGSSNDAVMESCFAEVTRDAAVQLLGFPELAALSKAKRSPEKIFRFLDMYNSVEDLRPEITDLFSFGSTAIVRSQVEFTQRKLAESVRGSVADFGAALEKESSKDAVPGGGVHPLTDWTMDYMVRLSNYGPALVDIYADCPILTPRNAVPEPFHGLIYPSSVPSSPCSTIDEEWVLEVPPTVSARLAWLLLVLLCKLDYKADLYKDPPLAYLFLANNLGHILSRVHRSRLSRLLGGEWAANHERKLLSFSRSYERLGWGKVLGSIPEDPAALMEEGGVAAVRERMKRFNKEFEEAYRKQAGWVVVDGRMRREMKVSVARSVVAPYRVFYEQCRDILRADRESIGVVRFAPEDVVEYLTGLFGESDGSSSSSGAASPASSSHGSAASSSSRGSRWRRWAVLRLGRR